MEQVLILALGAFWLPVKTSIVVSKPVAWTQPWVGE
jgi:hypothetical protein